MSKTMFQTLFTCFCLLLGTISWLNAQTILTALPDTSKKGQSFTMTITGTGTNFSTATGAYLTGGGSTIVSSTWNPASNTAATANFSIPANQQGGNYNVNVLANNPLFNGHYVRPSSILSISPDSAGLTQTVNVIINGMFTYWTGGTTVSMVGPGGTINASSVTVNSTQNMVATFSIPANPNNIGLWTIILSTGETMGGFEVLPGGGGTNYGRITGKVYHDSNSNCIFDLGDFSTPGNVVTITPGPYYASTDINGNYGVWVPLGTYNISTTVLSPDTFICPLFGTLSGVNVSTPGAVYPNNNFSSSGATYSNYYIHYCPPPIRPGFTRTIPLFIGNYGQSTAPNLQVKFKLPGFVNYISSNPPGATLSGDTVIWNFSNVNSISPSITFITPTSVTIGTPYTLEGWVNPSNTDVSLANNYQVLSQTVVGSYDPNDKQVFRPDGSNADGFIEPNDSMLRYMIRFQNTGTDTAFNIYIRDTLDPLLNISTFRMLQTSHPYVFTMGPNGELEWTFANILLPDSGANQAGSNGMLFYEIRPSSAALVGDTIKNKCGIYFDFNLPVITNTTQSILCLSYSVAWTSSIVSPGEVSFTDQSSGVTSLLWDFGDGNTSTLQFPTHQYAAPGMYTVCLYTLNSCGRPDSLCQTISVPVGIDDPNLQEFDLYPNPSTGEFIVRVKVTAVSTVNYRLINMLGQTVAEKEVNLVQGTRTERFDLSDQPEGIYLLRMEINGKQHFRKVVKR